MRVGQENLPEGASAQVPSPLLDKVGVPLLWLGIGFGVGYAACFLMTRPRRESK